MDIIATATGRIIPSGQIKLIQPFEIGVVKSIRVADGDHVNAGDLLLELDATTNTADQDRVGRDLVQARLDVARLTAALEGKPDAFVAPLGADPVLVDAARSQLMAGLAQQRAKLDGIDRQIVGKQAERDEAKASIAKVAASLPIVQQRVDIYDKLRGNEYTSKVAALEARQQLVEAPHDRAVAAQQLEVALAAIAALVQQRQATEAEFRQRSTRGQSGIKSCHVVIPPRTRISHSESDPDGAARTVFSRWSTASRDSARQQPAGDFLLR